MPKQTENDYQRSVGALLVLSFGMIASSCPLPGDHDPFLHFMSDHQVASTLVVSDGKIDGLDTLGLNGDPLEDGEFVGVVVSLSRYYGKDFFGRTDNIKAVWRYQENCMDGWRRIGIVYPEDTCNHYGLSGRDGDDCLARVLFEERRQRQEDSIYVNRAYVLAHEHDLAPYISDLGEVEIIRVVLEQVSKDAEACVIHRRFDHWWHNGWWDHNGRKTRHGGSADTHDVFVASWQVHNLGEIPGTRCVRRAWPRQKDSAMCANSYDTAGHIMFMPMDRR